MYLRLLRLSVLLLLAFVAAAQEKDSANLPSNTTPQLIPRTHQQREQRFLTQHRIILEPLRSLVALRGWRC